MKPEDARCIHFHEFSCGRLDACPTPCRREEFYTEFYDEEEDVPEPVVQ